VIPPAAKALRRLHRLVTLLRISIEVSDKLAEIAENSHRMGPTRPRAGGTATPRPTQNLRLSELKE
jgi:hypothetical protein